MLGRIFGLKFKDNIFNDKMLKVMVILCTFLGHNVLIFSVSELEYQWLTVLERDPAKSVSFSLVFCQHLVPKMERKDRKSDPKRNKVKRIST